MTWKTNQELIAKGNKERNLGDWIKDKERDEKLKLFHADLEAVVDICTRIQRELESMLGPPPYKLTDPKARVIVAMSKIKEATNY